MAVRFARAAAGSAAALASMAAVRGGCGVRVRQLPRLGSRGQRLARSADAL